MVEKRIQFSTPPKRETLDEEAADEVVEVSWSSLSPEMQQTELLAALKDKTVCAALKAAGMELCKAADARKSNGRTRCQGYGSSGRPGSR